MFMKTGLARWWKQSQYIMCLRFHQQTHCLVWVKFIGYLQYWQFLLLSGERGGTWFNSLTKHQQLISFAKIVRKFLSDSQSPQSGRTKQTKKGKKKAWEFVDTIPLYIGNSCTVLGYIDFRHIERFSNDCIKPKTKAITPTNHDRGKQRDEPITIPCNYMKLEQSARKITRTWRDWFWFCFSLAKKTGASLLSQSLSAAIAITQLLSTVIWKLPYI